MQKFPTIDRLFSNRFFAPDGGGEGGGSGAPGGAPASGAPPAATPAAGGAPAGGTPGAGGGAGGFDWQGSLGGDFATYKGVIEADKLADPKAALAALTGMKTRMASMVTPPGKDATPEQRNAFYAALGRPESPDKYDLTGFKPPEGLPWDGNAQTAMVANMHALGLNQDQVAGMLGMYGQVYAGQGQARDAAAVKAATDAEAALKKEWGDGYAAKMDLANRAVKTAFGDELKDGLKIRLEDGRYLLDHPGLARVFALLGERAAEPGSLPGGKGAPGAADEAVSTEEYYREIFHNAGH